MFFNGIQASYAGLFDAKKKEPFGGGEPRQEWAAGQKKICVIHIDFMQKIIPQTDNRLERVQPSSLPNEPLANEPISP